MSEYSYCPNTTYELVNKDDGKKYESPYCEKIILEKKKKKQRRSKRGLNS